ncbi:MAG: aldo/keto reductase, partial [Proteobacteria bacterium]|nr:aldo/keto reductase [Pseudomonadota bacterium]
MTMRALGNSNVMTSSIGIGCNRLINLDDKEAVAAVEESLERGINHFDTAESYGNGAGETFLGELMKGRREKFMVASKFGMRPGPDGPKICATPEYLRDACEKSLQRLQTDYIDLYYQHRVDPNVPIEETWGAMKELVEAGKVKSLGLSRGTPDEIRRVHAIHPKSAQQ